MKPFDVRRNRTKTNHRRSVRWFGYDRFVLSRRRFMFLLGGATTGLWLASTGLVRLERNFVMSLAGSCSFCGKDRREVKALVGTAGHAPRICDECVGLCCEILGEEVEIESPRDVHRFVAPNFHDEQFQDRVTEILGRLAAERESSRNDALLNDLRRSFESDRQPILDMFRCSFCDAHRKDVAKLISGPRVFICDACIGDATAVVTHVLRAT